MNFPLYALKDPTPSSLTQQDKKDETNDAKVSKAKAPPLEAKDMVQSVKADKKVEAPAPAAKQAEKT